MLTPTARTVAFTVCACLALSLSACSNQSSSRNSNGNGGKHADGVAVDASALQGRWEQLPDQPGGSGTPRQRVVKDVNGNTETVTTYGPSGQVVRTQQASFKLSRSGPVGVYTVENPKITSGEGDATKARLKYVYRVHGNELDEVWGLLPGQEEREVVVKRWRREGAGR